MGEARRRKTGRIRRTNIKCEPATAQAVSTTSIASAREWMPSRNSPRRPVRQNPSTRTAHSNSIRSTVSTEITLGPLRRRCRRARLAAELKGEKNLISCACYLSPNGKSPRPWSELKLAFLLMTIAYTSRLLSIIARATANGGRKFVLPSFSSAGLREDWSRLKCRRLWSALLLSSLMEPPDDTRMKASSN